MALLEVASLAMVARCRTDAASVASDHGKQSLRDMVHNPKHNSNYCWFMPHDAAS